VIDLQNSHPCYRMLKINWRIPSIRNSTSCA